MIDLSNYILQWLEDNKNDVDKIKSMLSNINPLIKNNKDLYNSLHKINKK